MIGAMSEKRQPGVIGSLPSTRPHRRSGKRATSGGPGDAPAPASAAPAGSAGSAAKPKPTAKTAAAKRTPTATGKTAAKPKPSASTKAAPRPERAKPAAARTLAGERVRAVRPPSPAAGERVPAGRPPSPARDPAPASPTPAPASHGALQTAVEAAAELTEIGLRAGARALRVALSRLPKP